MATAESLSIASDHYHRFPPQTADSGLGLVLLFAVISGKGAFCLVSGGEHANSQRGQSGYSPRAPDLPAREPTAISSPTVPTLSPPPPWRLCHCYHLSVLRHRGGVQGGASALSCLVRRAESQLLFELKGQSLPSRKDLEGQRSKRPIFPRPFSPVALFFTLIPSKPTPTHTHTHTLISLV